MLDDILAMSDDQLNALAISVAERDEQAAQVLRAIAWSPATNKTHAAQLLQSAASQAGVARLTEFALMLAAHPTSNMPAALTDSGAVLLVLFGSPRQKTALSILSLC